MVCFASSLVGARMRLWMPCPSCVFSMMGRAKQRVFPEPVSDWARRSLPVKRMGRACSWTWVRCSMCCFCNSWTSSACKCICSNFIVVFTFLMLNQKNEHGGPWKNLYYSFN